MIELQEHAGGAVLEVRLARPPANALVPELLVRLREAVQAAPDRGARALVLSGAPGIFSAGLDVPHFVTLGREDVRSAWRALFELMEALVRSPIPVVAALTGHAPAGGCVLALCCDWRVLAAERARIGLNEVQVGVRVPQPILAAAAHVVGARQAERLCTTAVLLEPPEALAIGLVDELAPADRVVARAVERAAHYPTLPAAALLATRELCRRDVARALEAMDEDELEHFLDEWFGEECQGALHALIERLAKR